MGISACDCLINNCFLDPLFTAPGPQPPTACHQKRLPLLPTPTLAREPPLPASSPPPLSPPSSPVFLLLLPGHPSQPQSIFQVTRFILFLSFGPFAAFPIPPNLPPLTPSQPGSLSQLLPPLCLIHPFNPFPSHCCHLHRSLPEQHTHVIQAVTSSPMQQARSRACLVASAGENKSGCRTPAGAAAAAGSTTSSSGSELCTQVSACRLSQHH